MQEAAPLTFASGLANPFVHRLHQSPLRNHTSPPAGIEPI